MRVVGIVVVASMASCGVDEPAPVTSVVQSNATTTQGSSFQGSSFQGSSFQGSSFQGSSFQGSSFQGATLGSLSASCVVVSGTLVIAYTQNADGTWDERIPYRICHYNSDRTVRYGCTYPDLKTQPSPLAGLTFTATFVTPQGTTVTGRIEIGSAVGSVVQDTSLAMFPITGGASGTITTANCENPAGCRVNTDLWLYDVRFPDVLDSSGQPVEFCPPGQQAFALSGTWDATGKFTSSRTQFTFACTSGTIAKCTRWGYRPWVPSATMSDGITTSPLAPFHEACIRAAMADYCGVGVSFTHNGTIVDVYDYPKLGANVGAGFIPRHRWLDPTITVFTFESTFDPIGATEIDHTRYAELQPISSPDNVCPGRFWNGSGDVGLNYNRDNTKYPIDTTHDVSIDSAPACAHSELMIGKWLKAGDPGNGNSDGCSKCTEQVLWHNANAETGYWPNSYCVSPTGKWDANCQSIAQQYCTGGFAPMTPHSECTTGAALPKFATGCTLKLALANLTVGVTPTSDCVDATKAWNQDCVRAAASLCTGGQETSGKLGMPITDFCGQKIGIGSL